MIIDIPDEIIKQMGEFRLNGLNGLITMSTSVIMDNGTVIKNRFGNQGNASVEIAQLRRRLEEIV